MATKAEKLIKKTERALETEGIDSEHGSGARIGMLLVLIGLVWLAFEIGWIPANWPKWPVILIAAGGIILLTRSKHKHH